MTLMDTMPSPACRPVCVEIEQHDDDGDILYLLCLHHIVLKAHSALFISSALAHAVTVATHVEKRKTHVKQWKHFHSIIR